MGKLNICAILIVFSLFMGMLINVSHARKEADEGDELLRENMCLKNQNLAKIHFYVHNVFGGPNGTVYEVARPVVASNASFGEILVIDSPITVDPSNDSERLGRVQGIMTSADMEIAAFAMNFNVLFTSGKYNGSTLSVAGRNEAAAPQRRIAVTGGTGVFRFSRGNVVVNQYSSRVEDSVIYDLLEYTIYATFCP